MFGISKKEEDMDYENDFEDEDVSSDDDLERDIHVNTKETLSPNKKVKFDESNLMSTKKNVALANEISNLRITINNLKKDGRTEERNHNLEQYCNLVIKSVMNSDSP
jgi:hypothetical protein